MRELAGRIIPKTGLQHSLAVRQISGCLILAGQPYGEPVLPWIQIHVTETCRRLAALLLLGTDLDENYAACAAASVALIGKTAESTGHNTRCLMSKPPTGIGSGTFQLVRVMAIRPVRGFAPAYRINAPSTGRAEYMECDGNRSVAMPGCRASDRI